MLVEIQHKITQDDLPRLIVLLENIVTDAELLRYFLQDCVMDLKGYLEE